MLVSERVKKKLPFFELFCFSPIHIELSPLASDFHSPGLAFVILLMGLKTQQAHQLIWRMTPHSACHFSRMTGYEKTQVGINKQCQSYRGSDSSPATSEFCENDFPNRSR